MNKSYILERKDILDIYDSIDKFDRIFSTFKSFQPNYNNKKYINKNNDVWELIININNEEEIRTHEEVKNPFE